MGATAEDAVDAAATNGGNGNREAMSSSAPPPPSGSGASSRYLAVFHAVSAGLNGAALGSDEQEIVFIVAVVLDVRDNQVRQPNESLRNSIEQIQYLCRSILGAFSCKVDTVEFACE